ncbi:MAG: putative transport system permease protein, partial [Actinomycetota bacterium]|nr:putative transport system permease protein [Actinomycetota bacterium]
ALRINGRVESALAFRDVRGHIGPSVVEGRAPKHDNEVLLGTKSASALHVNVGDVVKAKSFGGTRANLEVVGLGLFPSLDSDDFTKGVATTPAYLRRFLAKEWQPGGGHQVVVFRWVPGTDAIAASARLRGINIVTTPVTPASDIANLRVVRSYPRWLAIFLAVLGLLASTHALVVSTRRRRHEMGVLRAVGFSRRQVSRAVSTQGATIGAIAVVVGAPIGVALGRWVWVTHARRIGIGTGAPAPVVAFALVVFGAIATTWLIATAAGRRASRARLTNALRVE